MTRSRIVALRLSFLCGGWGLLLGVLGCGSNDPPKADLPVPIVTVDPPVERMVTRYEYATGRTAPLEQVDVRARVSGYLKAIYFQEGREVKKGDKLFEIDPEPFVADLNKAKATLETAEAELKTSEADQVRAESRQNTTKLSYDREEDSFKKGVGSEAARDIAKGMFDEAVASLLAAKAKVKLSTAKTDEGKASVRLAELNLGYCSISAEIGGVVGDRLVTVGNLVSANVTLLTTIVAVEKMDVAFDVDENTLRRIEQAVRDGKIKVPAPGEIPAEAGLGGPEDGYKLKGYINFANNQFDQKTGTRRMKARFDNQKPLTGPRLLSAGMYARVRVPLGAPVRSMLVPESAFGSDQGIEFLYLLGPENKAIRVDATLGVQEGELRVVESVEVPGEGKPRPLTLEDKVIVSGIQRVRPNMTVDPKPPKK
jgi:membrane fusion protein, multidrug efflux system